jgi:hypothetical protein
MPVPLQIKAKGRPGADSRSVSAWQPFFSIADLAERWRCSRGTVYNVLRGHPVLDFARIGHKGKKLVPAEIVRAIEQSRMKVWR